MIGCCPATANFYGRKQRGRETRAKYTQEILKRYSDGESTDAIGRSIGATGGLVKTIVRENGGHIKTIAEWKRKHALNERFFQTIDTEEKAYFLGFMYADGSVNPVKKTVCLSQAEPDADMLLKLKAACSSAAPVRIYRRSHGDASENRHATAMLNLHSSSMVEDLISHGCVPNKTFKTRFPFDSVPTPLRRHFIRGYFDGDGSIPLGARGKPMPSAVVVGTKEFLDEILMVTASAIGEIKHTFHVRHPERNHNITQLHISTQSEAVRFLWWLYNDASVFMDRKMSRYIASAQYLKNRIMP